MSPMSITTLELQRDLDAYLELSETEDVYITRNGGVVAKLSNPNQDRIRAVESLLGVLPAEITLEEAREERLDRI